MPTTDAPSEPIELGSAQEVFDISPEDTNVLLGNGFSIGADSHFSYQALYDEYANSPTPDQKILDIFQELTTTDFEAAMSVYAYGAIAAKAYATHTSSHSRSNHSAVIPDYQRTYLDIGNALIDTICDNHPSSLDALDKGTPQTAVNFLTNFKNIYTTNYDCILYWLEREGLSKPDGFYGPKDQEGFSPSFQTNNAREIHHLHGAIYIFNHSGSTRKIKRTTSSMLDNIKHRFNELNNPEVQTTTTNVTNPAKLSPIIITEDTAKKKRSSINRFDYTVECFNTLGRQSGCLVIYGLSADERDWHILDQLFSSTQLSDVVFSYYKPADKANFIKYLDYTSVPYSARVHMVSSSVFSVW